MRLIKMKQLSWTEICRLYAGQQICICDVQRDSNNKIVSATVVMTRKDHSRNDILRRVAESGGTLKNIYVPSNDFQELATTGYVGI